MFIDTNNTQQQQQHKRLTNNVSQQQYTIPAEKVIYTLTNNLKAIIKSSEYCPLINELFVDEFGEYFL